MAKTIHTITVTVEHDDKGSDFNPIDLETAGRLVRKLLDIGIADASQSSELDDYDTDADLITETTFTVH